MGKSELTLEIEERFIRYTDISNGKKFVCQEVAVTHKAFSGTKNVDLLVYDRISNQFICYEIKISKSDFNSENGHNFVGHKNYYIVPTNLVEYAKEKLKWETKIGLVEYENEGNFKRFTVRKQSKRQASEMDFGTQSILMFNLMKALHREIRKKMLKEWRLE